VRAIARLIQANLTLRVFLPLLVLALATTWYGLFYSVEQFAGMTNGLSFMDMQPLLSVEQLFEQIPTYSDATVSFYLGWSLFDYAWPFISFTTMLFISGWLLSFTALQWQQRFWMLVGSAYATVLFDWAENAGFIALVMGLPAQPAWLAQLTLGLHVGKLVCNMVFNLMFWALLLGVIVSSIKTRLSN
jgi:hypothetical protein